MIKISYLEGQILLVRLRLVRRLRRCLRRRARRCLHRGVVVVGHAIDDGGGSGGVLRKENEILISKYSVEYIT